MEQLLCCLNHIVLSTNLFDFTFHTEPCNVVPSDLNGTNPFFFIVSSNESVSGYSFDSGEMGEVGEIGDILDDKDPFNGSISECCGSTTIGDMLVLILIGGAFILISNENNISQRGYGL